MGNVARMHAIEVPRASGIARVHMSILSARGIACILATLPNAHTSTHPPCAVARSDPNPNPKPKSYTRVA